jgi:flagellar basal-body rod modification protein FlgD
MANDSNIGSLSNLDQGLRTSSNPSTAKTKKKAGDTQITGTDFLNLLVEQLKNQDPLNPMDNQQFAVQLSQFSSLEQLISINDKVGSKGSTDSFGSLASFLGQEVVTNSKSVTLNGRDIPSVSFNLPEDAAGVNIELIDAKGDTVAQKSGGALGSGRHSVSLDDVTAPNGDYRIKITSNKVTGGSREVDGFASGIVSGFIPGATPKLILNGREIVTTDIKEVRSAS